MCVHAIMIRNSVQDHADSNRDVIFDVDPEAVRKGIRFLMQQVAQIERERVTICILFIIVYNRFLIIFIKCI